MLRLLIIAGQQISGSYPRMSSPFPIIASWDPTFPFLPWFSGTPTGALRATEVAAAKAQPRPEM